MSRPRSHQRIDFGDPQHLSRSASAGLVIVRPTIVLNDNPPPSAASRRGFELQRLLEEPLTIPLGSMQMLHAGQWPWSPADEQQTETEARGRRHTRCADAYEHADEQVTAHARPTRTVQRPRAENVATPRSPAPPATASHEPWAARAAAARVLARTRAAAPQAYREQAPAAPTSVARWPSQAPTNAPWLVQARPQPSAASIRSAQEHWPWHPNARLPRNSRPRTHAYHRASAGTAWTWPVTLSLCSMLLAYAITARMLSRAALEHTARPTTFASE